MTDYAIIATVMLPMQGYRLQTPLGLSGLMSYLSTSPHIICISVYLCSPTSMANAHFISFVVLLNPHVHTAPSPPSLSLFLSAHLPLLSVNWMSCHSFEDD